MGSGCPTALVAVRTVDRIGIVGCRTAVHTGAVGWVGTVDRIAQMGSDRIDQTGSVVDLDRIGSMGQIGSVGCLDQIDSVDRIGQTDHHPAVGHTGSVGCLDKDTDHSVDHTDPTARLVGRIGSTGLAVHLVDHTDLEGTGYCLLANMGIDHFDLVDCCSDNFRNR